MDLPLNSSHSDSSRGGARPGVPDDVRDVVGAAPLAAVTTPLASPVVVHSTGAGDFADGSTAFNEWAFVWRRPNRAGKTIGIDPLRLVAVAALTSAAVSLLTIWASGGPQLAVPGNEWVPVVTVSYEPLEPAPPAEPAAATESPATNPEAASEGTLAPATLAAERATVVPRDTTRSAPAGFNVTSQPEGAHVTVNGVGYGVTPLTIPFLPPGARRVRVTKAGYQSEERFLGDEAARAATRLRIVLREIPGGGDSR